MGSLEGRTGLLTGATGGVGRALARELAERGTRLVVSSRGGPGLTELAEELPAVALEADLTRPGEVDGLARAVRDELGGAPDLLLNNAGVFRLAPAHATDPDVLDRHLAVNLSAPFRLARAFLPDMLNRGSGWLVHSGSVAGRQALPGNVAYSASKYGLRGLHEVLEVELEGSGVRTLLVEPGPVDTGAWDALEDRLGEDLPPRSAMLRPEVVARRVAEALEEKRDGVLPIRGG